MVQPTLPDISPEELRFLEDVRRQLEEDGTLLPVQACAVPLSLEPDLARLILASPGVQANPHPDQYLAEIYSLPFVHRYPNGMSCYDESARQYFDGLWTNGGSKGTAQVKAYASLNSLIADYYGKQLDQIKWEPYSSPSHDVRRLTFREAFHRLAAQPEQGLRFLGNFIAQSYSNAAQADAYAATNICAYRAPFISQEMFEVKFIWAKYHYLSGNYKEARPFLLAIYRMCASEPNWLSIGPRDQRLIWAIAAHFLGCIELKQRRVPQAIGILRTSAQVERTLEDWNGVLMTLNTLGKAYLADHKPKEAIAVLQESIRIDPNPSSRAMTLNTLGKAYLDDHQPKEAIAVLQESASIDLDPSSRTMTLNTLGNAYIDDRQPKEAIAVLQESDRIALDPHSRAMILNTLGKAYRANNQPKEAIAVLREGASIDLDPSSRAMTLNTLGKAYLDDHQPKEAIDVLQEGTGIDLDPSSRARSLKTLGKAYIDDHQPKEAIDVLQESARIEPNPSSRPFILIELANAYLYNDDPTTAVEILSDSLNLLEQSNLEKSVNLRHRGRAHNLRAKAYVRIDEIDLGIVDYRACAAINRQLGETRHAFLMDYFADQLEAGNKVEKVYLDEEADLD